MSLHKLQIFTCFVLSSLAVSAQSVLTNGNFETATNPATTTTNGYTQTNSVAGWQTSASDGLIEIWRTGYQGVDSANGPAGGITDGGQQFAEVNANDVATLFQDVTIIQSGGVDYSFLHRGRLGSDTMRLTISYLGADGIFGGTDDITLVTRNVTDDNVSLPGEFNGWNQYSADDAFTSVPNGKYRFAFTAISSANGNNAAGNFLDNATFGVGVIPEPSTVFLLIWGVVALAYKASRRGDLRVN